MKRRWAVLLTAAAALGCRSSQPTTNPFLRTTVPPPGTGQGAVVVPGEPYYPGGAPPVGAAPIDPAGAPVVPLTPPGAAPPPAAPLRNNKYSPAGGSFMYNQSSIQRRKAQLGDGRAADGETAVAATSRARDDSQPPSLDELRLPSVEHAVEQATRLSVEPDVVELAHTDGAEPTHSVASAITDAMPKQITSPDAALEQSAAAIRQVQPPSDNDDGSSSIAAASESTASATVLRITSGTPPRAESAGSRLVIKQDNAPSVAQSDTGNEFAGDWAATQPRQGTSRPPASLGRSSTWRASASRPQLGSSAL